MRQLDADEEDLSAEYPVREKNGLRIRFNNEIKQQYKVVQTI